MKIIGLIPARGGRKGIPLKNIIDLNGHPLIEYTIKACEHSNLYDYYCTSDSNKILNVASTFGCKGIRRPKKYATDSSPMLDVLKHFRDTISSMEWDAIFLLYPVYPNRDEHLINSAIEEFEKNSDCSLMGFHEPLTHPYLCYSISNGISRIMDFDIQKYYRRQDYPQIYEYCSAVCIVHRDEIDNLNNQLYNDKTKAFIIKDKRDGINIDTLEDLEYARFLFAQK